jgi:competence protein ComEA
MILGRILEALIINWEFPNHKLSLKKRRKEMIKRKRLVVLSIAIAIVMVFIVPAWAADAGKINLNKATVEELIQLKGIGQKYAERIIQFREKNGPFKKTEDLMNVPGIGPKIWEKNKDRIVVE